MRNSNTTALSVDLITGKSEAIQVGGYNDIRARFVGDVRGETIRELGESTFLRKWTAVDPDPGRRIAIYDAYSVPGLQSVDLPITAKTGLEISI
jgi:hypothetical protein